MAAPLAMFLAEVVMAALVVSLAAFLSAKLARFARIEALLATLASRPALSVAALLAFTWGTRLALLPLLPVPQPLAHDEYAYLLAADTFASGRLANPTPPGWQHFEAAYLFFEPTYGMKFPPAQSLALAAGQLLGHPWIGVLLSAGALVVAIWWMLRGWFSPGWALLGGFLAALRYGIFSYWANSYWGGAVAAIGGALLFGGLARLFRKPSAGPAICTGVGLLILANSRPYEGLLAAFPATGALVFWVFRQRDHPRARVFAGLLLPLGLVLAAGFAATGYYFWRVTGDPLRMPYTHYQELYGSVPHFVLGAPYPARPYRHEALRQHFDVRQRELHAYARSPQGFLRRNLSRLTLLWTFFLGPVLSIPFLFVPGLWKQRGLRLLWMPVAVSAAGMAFLIIAFPHYAAPLTAPIVALVVAALRDLDRWRLRGRPAGAIMVRLIPLALVAVLAFRVVLWKSYAAPPPASGHGWPEVTWCCAGPGDTRRARLLHQLQANGGHHLVFVRYDPTHDYRIDWVYNPADLETAPVLWAREIDASSDAALLRSYPNRRVWVINADREAPALEPYRLR